MLLMPKLEIATTSLDDAIAAQQGGADSIEISYNLAAGGLTPSLELVLRVRDAVTLDVYVIVRPHHRDFFYTPAETESILADAAALGQVGIQGVVFGALAPDRRLHIDLIRQVQDAAGIPLTVHRALDESTDPDRALHRMRGIVPRILTSGPAPNTWEGRDGLRRWVADHGAHFEFVASGGLRADTLAEYAAYVRADTYHLGGAARTNDAVDVEKVQQLRAILQAI